MLFKETPNKGLPTIILLHGGGLSWWSLQKITNLLEDDFHVVTPIIDGHGEDAEQPFVSIEDSASKVISYIDTQLNGKVFALGGLSLGGQIVTEILSQRKDIVDYAIIESALVLPLKTAKLMAPLNMMYFGLIKQRWFSKIQARSLGVPPEMFELYYRDSSRISKQTLIAITLSNGNYDLKSSIADTKAKVLIIAGDREIKIIKRSAERLHRAIKGSQLHYAPAMVHGELSLKHPEEYVALARRFWEG